MSTTSTTSPRAEVSTSSRPRAAAIGAAIAALLNTGLWLVGSAADASFQTSPPLVEGGMKVGLLEIIPATVLMFLLGWWLLARAARRSRALARRVLVAAPVFAVLSAAGPLTTAEDTATGVLLATMHLVTAAVFVVSASVRVGRRAGSPVAP